MTQSPARHICLIVPGLEGSGSDHWQTQWEQERSDCIRVELGSWEDPNPRLWTDRLDAAVRRHQRHRIVLVAHSLGCQAVAWWSRIFADKADRRVAAALLVAPPDVERSADERIQRFAPLPTLPLPFPSLVVASRNDPHARIDRSEGLARRLGAELVDVGYEGHINASSRLGTWPDGQQLLEGLVEAHCGGT